MKEYKIEGNKALICIDKTIYPLIAIKKAMLNYLENMYIEAEEIDNSIQIIFEATDRDINIEKFELIIKEFINDCLRESIRYDIMKETKNIRELIVGRALYSACVKIDDSIEETNEAKYEIIEDEEFDLDEIAVNWFEKYGDNSKK